MAEGLKEGRNEKDLRQEKGEISLLFWEKCYKTFFLFVSDTQPE
jgi:hypothetical protein